MIARRDEQAERDARINSLKKLLLSRGAVNLHAVTDHLGVDPTTAAQHLDTWITSGDVEVLHPVGSAASNRGETAYDAIDSFFRWRRPWDRDFLWMQRI